MNTIFAPATQDGLQISDYKIDEVFSLVTGEPNVDNFHIFTVNNQEYRVNLGTDRYHIFKANRRCVCCGVIGTRMSLDKNAQLSKEKGSPCYHFNLYAESTDEKLNVHTVLMVKDHIVPRASGGTEEISNFQTMCFNCNSLKDCTSLSLEQMQKALFPAYRAYKSTQILNKTKELLEPYRLKIKKNRHSCQAINDALNLVKDEQRAIQMKEKIKKLYAEAEWLEKECDALEIQAQVDGYVPYKPKYPKLELEYKS